jgi:hypothetical protein
MRPALKISFFFLITGFIFFSCKKDDRDASALPVKIHPVPIAGDDKTVILPADSVLLSGSGRDMDGTIIKYSWNKISGPSSFIIANSTAAVTKVINLVLGIYVFELTVTDNDGLSSKDTVTIYVINSCPCVPDCDPWGNPCDPWDY